MNLHFGTAADGGIVAADGGGIVAADDGGIVAADSDFAMLDFAAVAVAAEQYYSYNWHITRTYAVAEDGICSAPYANTLAHVQLKVSHTCCICQSAAFCLLLEVLCYILDIAMFCGNVDSHHTEDI